MSVFTDVTMQQAGSPAIKWIDARFSLQHPEAGKQEYKEGHIRGAVHWDLEDDLSDMSKKGGRHPLPDHAQLTALFRQSGLQIDDEIIIYDHGGEPFALRAWWILTYAGFLNVKVALQGFEELAGLGAPVGTAAPSPEHTTVEPRWNEAILARKSDVAAMTANQDRGLLLDARAAVRYRGEQEPLDKIAGHIPGAVNFDWAQLAPGGKFDLQGEAAGRLSRLAEREEPVTVYCGSGVTAVPLFAVLKEKGFENVRLYAGSYSDWVEDGDREVATGDGERREQE